ncbi:cytochrome P450 [Saccharopolyspora sp. NPDC000995]
MVLLRDAAAHHDEAAFAEPERFDITSADSSHLTFGHSPRYCVGASLSRIELQAMFSQLVPRFPTMRLAGVAARRDTLTGGLTELRSRWRGESARHYHPYPASGHRGVAVTSFPLPDWPAESLVLLSRLLLLLLLLSLAFPSLLDVWFPVSPEWRTATRLAVPLAAADPASTTPSARGSANARPASARTAVRI